MRPFVAGDIVIGELTPFLLDGARHLLPIAFDLIPIHRLSPFAGLLGRAERLLRTSTHAAKVEPRSLLS